MSGKCKTSAFLTPGKYPDILEQETGLTPELSGRFGEKYLSTAGIGTPDRPGCNLVKVAHEILWTSSLPPPKNIYIYMYIYFFLSRGTR